MKTYEFTLILGGVDELTEDLAAALFEAGCDDGSPGQCNGVVMVDFDREANSLEEAIRSAIANVQAAGCIVTHAEIEAESLAVPSS